MNKYKNLTIFFVSYFSSLSIKKVLKKIDPRVKVLVIDNAKEKGSKKKFSKFKNVKIIVSKHNTGQTGGINLGFKNISSKYAIYMDSDIDFKKSIIDKFLDAAKKIDNFVILAPQHEKSKYINDFLSTRKNNFKEYQLMKIVHGQFLFFQMKNVKKVGLYDEKIFLYYDETDFCLRAYRKKQNIYVLPKIKVEHLGGKSVNLPNTIEIEANKNWHFMWSKFYFFKKNFTTLFAFKKTALDLFIDMIKFCIFFPFDYRKRTIYLNRISGLINSYLGSKSFRRINIK